MIAAIHHIAAAQVVAKRRAETPVLRLSASDPNASFGLQVGDALTFVAQVRDPNVKVPRGSVEFCSNDRYLRGCRRVTLRGGKATDYLTFYSPGNFQVTARYFGADHRQQSVTLRFSVVPSTDD